MTVRGLPTTVCLLATLGVCAAGGGGAAAESGAGASAGSAAAMSAGGSTVGAATNSPASLPQSGGGGNGVGAGGDPSGAPELRGVVRPYSLRPIYFRRDQFKTTADCLAAAYSRRLPLEVCQ